METESQKRCHAIDKGKQSQESTNQRSPNKINEMFKGQCSTCCSSSKSATSCMRRLATAAASRLDRNVGALGLSNTGLAGTFVIGKFQRV